MKIVVSYRGVPRSPGWETGAKLARAFRPLGHSVYEYGNYYGSTRRISKEPICFDPDLLVYCECNDRDPQYKELKWLDAPIKVYWDFDVHTHPDRILTFIKDIRFDYVFVANKLYEQVFLDTCPESYFLPYAIDDKLHCPIPNIPKTIDVGLCGSPYPERVYLIEKFQEAGINAQLITGKYDVKMVRTINSFKIHLNYNPSWGRGILTGRIWETIGCGVLLLNQSEDFIEYFFTHGEHVVLYDGIGDCINKAKYLLANEDELERIARTGYEYGIQHHTYLIRAKRILEVVNGGGSRCASLPSHWQLNYKVTSVRTRFLTSFYIQKRRFRELLKPVKEKLRP